jgi:hypothetical protein
VRDALGPDAVHTVQLQSAPGSPASAEAFTASLEYALALEWDGLRVVVEHCDARTGLTPQKGFLPLPDEQRALEAAVRAVASPPPTGHTVNWARSVIEEHDALAPERQIARLVADGVLAGIMFSGVAPVDTVFGRAWADAHLPVSAGGAGSEPESLLTPDALRRTLAGAATAVYLGAKVSAPKTDDIALLDRLNPGITTLASIAEELS